ncbi:hypothetical protein H7K06_24475 [Priestia aryabhattai]|uniref:NACHT domain-containing protein n=1 Tax=Priestia aryabhattai TaxID=412384 RepID=UPI001C8D11FC|nr:hypothetical protein [Priestia aryabhattai]MBX9970690.1 hypothetical protein [Priestia aryabhattai]
MSKYSLNNFGAQKFEMLSQNLVQQIIGPGAKVYGMGKDGAREATFKGKAPYPSKEEIWQGDWIFQAKFHDVQQIGQRESRKILFRELDDELETITQKYHHPCDNYILITNVSLSPVYKTGLKDKIDQILIPKYGDSIKNIHVWGAEEICSLLDIYPNIRQRYSELLVSGDIISKLMGLVDERSSDLDEKVDLYCQGAYRYDSAVALDDAGDMDDQKVDLSKVFIDLNVNLSKVVDSEIDAIPEWMKKCYKEADKETALTYILDDSIKRMVFVGGPGLGKSTLGQYISQVYRARLIGKLKEFDSNKPFLESVIPRIPFRIILKDFASWFIKEKNTKVRSLFHFLSHDLSESSNIEISVNDIHKIIKNNPVMIVLDGLDEVPEKKLRQQVLDRINTFITQITNVYNSDYRIIASTRPQGYTDEFDPTQYLHINLQELNEDLAINYATRWVNEKEKNPKEVSRILSILGRCLKDKIVKDLTKTPLQITILLVIIRAGSTPPKQREELYQTYMDTIYRREHKKGDTLIRSDKSLIYGLHQYLGYLLHKRTEKNRTDALMTIEEFEQQVKNFLIYLDPILDDEQLYLQSQQIITEARGRLILIESPQQNKIGFTLTVMREFFAAGHLVETSKNSNERNERFKSIAKSPYWSNVALFFAGRVGRTMPEEASSLIDICREIDTEAENQYLKRGSQLALEIVKDKALRVRYNELSAIYYSLSILETDILINYQDIISVLKENIINETFANQIEIRLIEKINNVKPEKVKKYLNLYYELFGFKDKILKEIKKLTSYNEVKIEEWEFKLITDNQVYEEWVVEFLEKLFHELDGYLSFDTEEYKLENLIPLYKLNLNDDTQVNLSKFLYEALDIRGIKDPTFERVMEKILNEENELRDPNYLLPWGVCYAIISSLNKEVSFNRKRAYLPYISYFKFNKYVKENKKLLAQFILTYKKTDSIFTNFLTNLFEFYLDPENLECFLTLTNYEDDLTFGGIMLSLFGGMSEEHKDTVENLLNLYKSDRDLEKDLKELDEILVKTDKDFSMYSFWLQNDGNPLFEEFLDPQIVSDIKEWIKERGLTYIVIQTDNWPIQVDLKKASLLELKTLTNKVVNDKEDEIKISGFLASYLQEATDEEKIEDVNKQHIVNDLLGIMKHLFKKQPNEIFTTQVFWLLLEIGEISEEYLKIIYNQTINENLDFKSSTINFRSLDQMLNNLVVHIDSLDKEVSLIASILLSEIVKRSKSFFHKHSTKPSSSVTIKYWNLILENQGVIRKKLLGGLEIFQLNWEEVKDYFLDDILSCDKEIQQDWINIIESAGYLNDNSRKALLELLIYILENEIEQKGLKKAATMRLQRESINNKFEENPLNLPLPRRENLSF